VPHVTEDTTRVWSSLLEDVTRRRLITGSRRFEKAYWSHLQG